MISGDAPNGATGSYTTGVQQGSSVAQSYNNPGGTGNRSGLITASASSGTLASGSASGLINGVTTGDTGQWLSSQTVSGRYIRFDFGVARVVTEAKWYQDLTTSQGTWKWQGSQDASSWTDIGSSFTLGGATTQTQTQLNGNATAYRYYQLLGVSGSSSTASYTQEIEFKLDDSSALNLTSLSVSGLAQFQGQMQLLQLPIWPSQSGSYAWMAPAAGGQPAFRAISRSDIGLLGLTPSDLPAIRFDAPLVNGQSLSFGDYNYLQTGTPTTNNLFTVSGTGNITFTSLYAGVLEIHVSITASGGANGMLRVEKNGSFVREGSVHTFADRVTLATAVPIAIGDVIKIPTYSNGSATLSVGSGAGTLFMALRS